MNNYQEKIEAKRERYVALATKNTEQANALFQKGSDALNQIPFGQPILIGHHSERSDRAYRSRAVGAIDRSFEVQEKADYYAKKAESVGTAGISSDDPEAIEKLAAKSASLEEKRQEYKQFNKTQKAKGEKTLPAFYLTNLGANIRSVTKRIEELENKKQMITAPDIIGEGYLLRENKEENRIQFFFGWKPRENVCQALKYHGFHWSPKTCGWQTFLTNRGRYKAKLIVQLLNNQ